MPTRCNSLTDGKVRTEEATYFAFQFTFAPSKAHFLCSCKFSKSAPKEKNGQKNKGNAASEDSRFRRQKKRKSKSHQRGYKKDVRAIQKSAFFNRIYHENGDSNGTFFHLVCICKIQFAVYVSEFFGDSDKRIAGIARRLFDGADKRVFGDNFEVSFQISAHKHGIRRRGDRHIARHCVCAASVAYLLFQERQKARFYRHMRGQFVS